ncbi:MAG: hypothetical protein Q9227_004813 [Pyrenula ochraceoflavens]
MESDKDLFKSDMAQQEADEPRPNMSPTTKQDGHETPTTTEPGAKEDRPVKPNTAKLAPKKKGPKGLKPVRIDANALRPALRHQSSQKVSPSTALMTPPIPSACLSVKFLKYMLIAGVYFFTFFHLLKITERYTLLPVLSFLRLFLYDPVHVIWTSKIQLHPVTVGIIPTCCLIVDALLLRARPWLQSKTDRAVKNKLRTRLVSDDASKRSLRPYLRRDNDGDLIFHMKIRDHSDRLLRINVIISLLFIVATSGILWVVFRCSEWVTASAFWRITMMEREDLGSWIDVLGRAIASMKGAWSGLAKYPAVLHTTLLMIALVAAMDLVVMVTSWRIFCLVVSILATSLSILLCDLLPMLWEYCIESWWPRTKEGFWGACIWLRKQTGQRKHNKKVTGEERMVREQDQIRTMEGVEESENITNGAHVSRVDWQSVLRPKHWIKQRKVADQDSRSLNQNGSNKDSCGKPGLRTGPSEATQSAQAEKCQESTGSEGFVTDPDEKNVPSPSASKTPETPTPQVTKLPSLEVPRTLAPSTQKQSLATSLGKAFRNAFSTKTSSHNGSGERTSEDLADTLIASPANSTKTSPVKRQSSKMPEEKLPSVRTALHENKVQDDNSAQAKIPTSTSHPSPENQATLPGETRGATHSVNSSYPDTSQKKAVEASEFSSATIPASPRQKSPILPSGNTSRPSPAKNPVSPPSTTRVPPVGNSPVSPPGNTPGLLTNHAPISPPGNTPRLPPGIGLSSPPIASSSPHNSSSSPAQPAPSAPSPKHTQESNTFIPGGEYPQREDENEDGLDEKGDQNGEDVLPIEEEAKQQPLSTFKSDGEDKKIDDASDIVDNNKERDGESTSKAPLDRSMSVDAGATKKGSTEKQSRKKKGESWHGGGKSQRAADGINNDDTAADSNAAAASAPTTPATTTTTNTSNQENARHRLTSKRRGKKKNQG